ncbi:MAG: hypothetical protein ABEI75_01840 [Halobaculum sp.]
MSPTRRSALASVGTALASGLAGCGSGGGTPTVPDTLPVVLQNRVTRAAVERSAVSDLAGEGLPVRIAVSTVDSESAAETELWSRETTVEPGQNRRWDDVLAVEEGVDEYVLKGELVPDAGPYSQDIHRFAPDEVADRVGPSLTVRIGLFPDGGVPGEFGLQCEPEQN